MQQQRFSMICITAECSSVFTVNVKVFQRQEQLREFRCEKQSRTSLSERLGSITGHQRSEAMSPNTRPTLIMKHRCVLSGFSSQTNTSDACVQTRRDTDKRGSNLDRRRARSADLEKMRRSQLTVVDDRWMTEYMRCFSARLR